MTYRGLPADYDAWKTRSDRDDQPEPEDTDMQEPYAKEIENALNQDLKADFPNARLGLKHPGQNQASPPTSRDRIGNTIKDLEHLVADFNTLIATLAAIKGKL